MILTRVQWYCDSWSLSVLGLAVLRMSRCTAQALCVKYMHAACRAKGSLLKFLRI